MCDRHELVPYRKGVLCSVFRTKLFKLETLATPYSRAKLYLPTTLRRYGKGYMGGFGAKKGKGEVL